MCSTIDHKEQSTRVGARAEVFGFWLPRVGAGAEAKKEHSLGAGIVQEFFQLQYPDNDSNDFNR